MSKQAGPVAIGKAYNALLNLGISSGPVRVSLRRLAQQAGFRAIETSRQALVALEEQGRIVVLRQRERGYSSRSCGIYALRQSKPMVSVTHGVTLPRLSFMEKG